MKVQANISPSTIQGMDNAIVEQSLPSIAEQVQNIDNFIKQAASEYLQVLAKAEKDINILRSLLIKQKAIRKSVGGNKEVYQQIEQYQKNKEEIDFLLSQSNITTDLYSGVIKFQTALNMALGQKVQTVYVFENAEGEPELYTIDDPIQVLKYSSSSKGQLSARFNVRTGDLDKALQRLKMDEPQDLTGLNTTYQYFKERYQKYGEKTRRVMWQNVSPPPKTKVLRISAAGDIAEAYASIVLNRKAHLFNNIDYRINMDYFAYYVMQVDSTSGLLEGDVTIGNVEYAIKSGNASMLGIKQVERIAKQIVENDNVDLEKIKADLHRRGRRRNKLEQGSLEKVVEKAFINLPDKY